jgi:hypothetical protein
MFIETPTPIVRDGEFTVYTNPSNGKGHFARIEMGRDADAWKVGLTLHDVSDCDRLIKAATAAKRMLEAVAAGTAHVFEAAAGPHGSHCGTCGELRGFPAHVVPQTGDPGGTPAAERALRGTPAAAGTA